MASDPFTIYTNELVNVVPIVNSNGKFIARTTPTQNNTQAKDSILVDCTFSEITLAGGGNPSLGGWGLRAIVESSDSNGNWHRVGAMFEPLRDPSQGLRQLIVVQPNIINLNEGVPYDDWDGSAVAYRLHRQQGALGIDFRIVIELQETKYGTTEAISSFRLKLFGERYSHV